MILYGKPVREKILLNLRNQIKNEVLAPSLAVILVGDDPASLIYIKVKEKVAASLGIDFNLYYFLENAREEDVLHKIDELNQDTSVSGIVIQLPLPEGIDTQKILHQVDIQKDVDGFLGKYSPPTVLSILEILRFYHIDLQNKNIVLMGHGELVGKPMEKELIKEGYKPIVCDSGTKDLSSILHYADVIISATGKNGLITPDMVKENAVIIDAGTAEANGKMTGDVTPEVQNKVASYSPVPGGVGPVTVAMLMRNVVESAKINK